MSENPQNESLNDANASEEELKKTESLLSALGTTAFVSMLLSCAVMVVYFSYFPPAQNNQPTQDIRVVDMMLVGATIAQMTSFDTEKSAPLFDAVQQKLMALREQGVIVLDARVVIALPPEAVIEPHELIPNVPEDLIEKTREAMTKLNANVELSTVTGAGQ